MNDFDFLVGEWDVASWVLRRRLAGDDEWEAFPGTSRCLRLFDGAANLDEFTFPTKGVFGLTLRTYDPARAEWSLYWVSSTDGLLQPPVVGRFRNGRGVFYGNDVYDGAEIRVRYIWSEITSRSARWEQAFSGDDGATWEINWIMELSRRDLNRRGDARAEGTRAALKTFHNAIGEPQRQEDARRKDPK
jgi:hypothetical protein